MGRISYFKHRGLITPDATFVKLRYVQDLYTVSFASGSSYSQDEFLGNSIYRPDEINGFVTSANGYSYYGQTYRKYVVLGSKIRVQACNISNTAARMFYVFPANDSLGSSTAANILQSQPYVKRTLLGVATGSGNTKVLSSYMSTRKILGKPGTTIDPQLSGTVGTGSSAPVNGWSWYIVFHQNNTDVTADLIFNVEITYYVKFWDRNTLNAYT